MLFSYNDMMFKCSIIMYMITVRYSTASTDILNFYIIHIIIQLVICTPSKVILHCSVTMVVKATL